MFSHLIRICSVICALQLLAVGATFLVQAVLATTAANTAVAISLTLAAFCITAFCYRSGPIGLANGCANALGMCLIYLVFASVPKDAFWGPVLAVAGIAFCAGYAGGYVEEMIKRKSEF